MVMESRIIEGFMVLLIFFGYLVLWKIKNTKSHLWRPLHDLCRDIDDIPDHAIDGVGDCFLHRH